MKKFSEEDLQGMERRFRGSFINSITGFKSLSLVGTADKDGRTNLSVFTQVFHIGANPGLIGMIVRPDTIPRHTLANLEEMGYYTLNHVTADFYEQAHQCSANYPEEVSEFEATGLTPVYSDGLPAPYVEESRVRIGLAFAERHDLEINGTILIIGRIMEIFAPEELLKEDGYFDLEQAGTVTASGLEGYHTTQMLGRMAYAKADLPPRKKD